MNGEEEITSDPRQEALDYERDLSLANDRRDEEMMAED
jgi:hypothetical protein